MIELLLFILVIVMLYIAWCYSQDQKRKKAAEALAELEASHKKELHIRALLLTLVGKKCKLVLKEQPLALGFVTIKTVTVIDVDSEWVLLSLSKRKTDVQTVIRISTISDVLEIKD